MTAVSPLLVFAVAAAVSVIGAALCKPLARRLGIVARPKADRWHRETVPLLGGVAMAGAVAAGTAFALMPGPPRILLAAGLVVALVGVIDDVRPLKPQTKLTALLLVAAAVVATGLSVQPTGVYWIDLVVSMAWLVALTNAFNLLDNMDGLAAGIAALASATQAALLLGQGDTAAGLLALAVTGAALGFLVHNFQPASIFMGDAGSLFLGFMVAGLSLLGAAGGSPGLVSVLLFPAMVALVPILDTTVVTLNRLVAGRPISQGGRDHTSHRLVAAGLTDRQAVLVLYGAAAVSGLIAVYTARFGFAESAAAVILFVVGVSMLGAFLGRIRVYTDAREGPPGGAWLNALTDFSYPRQAGAFVLDLLLVVLAYYSAYRLRFEQTFGLEEPVFIQSLPIVIACKMLAFALLRTYQGLWRYTSLRDLVRLSQAVSLGTVLSVLVILALYRFRGYSRALFVVDWLLLLIFAGGTRVLVRLLDEWVRPRPSNRRPVLIYGGGDGGVMVLREVRNNAELQREAVGFLDDDPGKQRTEIQGLPVLGGTDRLDEILQATTVAEVIVSSSRIPPERVEQVRTVCERHGVLVVRSVLRLE